MGAHTAKNSNQVFIFDAMYVAITINDRQINLDSLYQRRHVGTWIIGL